MNKTIKDSSRRIVSNTELTEDDMITNNLLTSDETKYKGNESNNKQMC